MTGWRGVPAKQRRAFRRRNHIARDLHTVKYGPKIRESKKHHLIDEATERELEEDLQRLNDDYDFFQGLGLTSKE